MYSVIDTNGFQQKVALGEKIKVPLIDGTPGNEHTFSDVLLFSDGQSVDVGAPHLDNASVKAEIIEQGKANKIKVFKKKKRKDYRLTKGHKQDYTLVRITEMSFGEKSGKAEKIAEKPKKAEKAEEK